MIPGGLSETRPATPEIQKIVDEVKQSDDFSLYPQDLAQRLNTWWDKKQLEEKTKEKYDGFKAVTYRSQVVAGFMYYVKVHLGCEQYAHLKIVEAVPHRGKTIELLNYQTGKTKEDELTSM